MATQQAHIEREQKFLVDTEEFNKLKPQSYKHIRQCYLSIQQDDALEVRFRSSYDTTKATTTYTQTIKRRRQDDAIGRDELEFAVSAEVFEHVWALSHWKLEKRRYCVDDWTVDVFMSGPLQSIAVAEMELTSEHADVAAYLAATNQAWPSWVYRPFAVDLTPLSVNLVAAGVKAVGHTLRYFIDDLARNFNPRKASKYE